ncbi:MAG: FAD-dependent oxidoreductase, partial [Peptococcaceae bacterium]|nr:FAD-dependent oxidoreductase [Peptococcaceae bacterium]
MIRVPNIKLSIEEETDNIVIKLAKKLKINRDQIIRWEIFKQSIDARKANEICFVYTIDAEIDQEIRVLEKNLNKDVIKTPDLSYVPVSPGKEKLNHPPVVVGTGPAGLFAGLLLAQAGFKPVILERGEDVDKRTQTVRHFWATGELNLESNVQFGEGGAGTFSDGKLTTLIKDTRCRKILEEFVAAGAPKEILYSHKPHVGTDILKNVVKNIRNKIIALGGNVCFNSKVTDFVTENNLLKSIVVNSNERITTDALILAIGHSSRDTFE